MNALLTIQVAVLAVTFCGALDPPDFQRGKKSYYGLRNWHGTRPRGSASITQRDLNYIGNSMDVRVKVVDNLEFDGAKHLFQVTLFNSGRRKIPGSQWTIYFYSFFMIEPDHLPKEGGVVLESEKIRLNHIQGGLFSLQPVSGFGDLLPRRKKQIKFFGQNWAVSKTDIPPNWYVTASNLDPRLIKSTSLKNTNFVADFTLPKQWKRYRADVFDPFTPEQRYDRYHMPDLGGKHRIAIIPTPNSMKTDDTSHVKICPKKWRIKAEEGFEREAKFLSEKTGIPFDECAVPDMAKNTISFVSESTLGTEEYRLSINTTAKNVVIRGKTYSGGYNGAQSIISMLEGNWNWTLPQMEISDKPRFYYRGMHVDVARNFHGKEDIKRLLDVMTMYKLNQLHFHLTDDEGWRIQIAGLPELTNIGGKRCHDLLDEECLIPQLGSGPDTTTSGSGYYTRSEYIEIVRYAEVRHIRVIPEIDMPGHARAAIKSMEARFKTLTDLGKPDADKYRLIDPKDTSKYSSVQMFNDNAINPCIESTYNFINKVVEDLIAMHKSAGQPLTAFHFGGDEVATGAWENSTACGSLNFKSDLTGRDKYKAYFTLRVSEITHLKGLSLSGWEDGLMDEDGNPFPRNMLKNDKVTGYAWNNVWEWGVAKRAYLLANANYKVVLSHATHLYFDQPYEPDPEERGLYWATRFTDTQKSFGYNANDLYKNIDTRRSGVPITKAEVCTEDNSGCPVLNKPENVIGMQGQLWSETVLTKSFFDYMIFPRILAVAERAWHEAPWETIEDKATRERETKRDWSLFADTIGRKELRRLDNLGVEYRVPPPGARLKNGRLLVNTEFPSLSVEYSRNGRRWRKLPQNFKPRYDILLRTRSKNGLRVSREIKVKIY